MPLVVTYSEITANITVRPNANWLLNQFSGFAWIRGSVEQGSDGRPIFTGIYEKASFAYFIACPPAGRVLHQ